MSDKEQPVQAEPQAEEAVEAQTMNEEQSGGAEKAADEAAPGLEDHTQELINELQKKLAAAEAKVEEQRDGVLRTKAEMENVRRRATQDVEKAHKFALEKFSKELLPVVDSMEMALSHADPENEAIKPMLEGVELTLKTLISAIEKFGVVAVDPMGDTFDPNKHQAMSMVESPDAEPNTVVAVMQKGYELNARLLRPAMVVVAKAPTAPVDVQA